MRILKLLNFLFPDVGRLKKKKTQTFLTFWNKKGQIHKAHSEGKDGQLNANPEPRRDNSLTSCLQEETDAGSSCSPGTLGA